MVSYLCCNCLLALAVLEVAVALTKVSRFLSFFEVVLQLFDSPPCGFHTIHIFLLAVGF